MADSVTPAANHGHYSTVTALLPYNAAGNVYAKVIDANSRQTTYQVFCPDAEPGMGNGCREKSGGRIIQGPKTFFMSHYYASDNKLHIRSQQMDCTLYPKKDSLKCGVTQVAYGDARDGMGAETYAVTMSTDGLQELMTPLTITEGIERLYTSSTRSYSSSQVPSTSTESASPSTQTNELAPPSSTSISDSIVTVIVNPTPAESTPTDSDPVESTPTEPSTSAITTPPTITATQVWSMVPGASTSSVPSTTPTQTGSGAGTLTTRNVLVLGMALFGGLMALL